jgi:putative transposase
VHSETGQTPLERFIAPGPPPLPYELALAGAFRWSERRTVSKTGTVGMHGNTYEVDADLAGRQVDLVFDPLDLADVAVQIGGRHVGLAVALKIKRHVHPRAQPPTRPAEPTGIDYLALIQKRHDQSLQQRIDYRHLPAPGGEDDHDDNKEMTG